MYNCKILLIHPVLWSHYKARVFSELHDICQAQNINFLALQLAPSWKGGKPHGSVDETIHNYSYKLLFNRDLEQIGPVEKTFCQLREVFAYDPDVLILPGYADISHWVILVLARVLLKTRVICSLDSTKYDRRRTFFKELLKRVFLKMCDATFCYGTAAAEYAESLGMKRENIYLRCQATDNAVVRETFDKAKKSKVSLKAEYGVKEMNFIFVGRLSPEKNIMSLMKAYARVKAGAVGKDWGLVVVGDGPQRHELESFVSQNLLEGVFFAGGKSWEGVSSFFALSDVFVLPSISEPWGLVANEAMLCGLPIIISNRTGASRDLVQEGVNGFKFNPESVEELAAAMLKFADGSVDPVQMGKKSLEIIRDYTPEVAAAQMLAGIKKVLK